MITTADFDTEIRRLAEMGYTSTQIAEDIGKTKTTILVYCRKHGIKLNRNPWASPIQRKIGKRPKRIVWNGPKAAPPPKPDSSTIGQAIEFMRRHYPNVYKESTLKAAKTDRIVCGAEILPPDVFLQKAVNKGFEG